MQINANTNAIAIAGANPSFHPPYALGGCKVCWVGYGRRRSQESYLHTYMYIGACGTDLEACQPGGTASDEAGLVELSNREDTIRPGEYDGRKGWLEMPLQMPISRNRKVLL